MTDFNELTTKELLEAIKSPDLEIRGDALYELGDRSRLNENWEEARSYFDAALQVYTDAKRTHEILRTSYALGFCMYRLQDYKAALNHLGYSLHHARQENNARTIGFSAAPMGDCHASLKRFDEAIEMYELAVGAFEEIEDSFQAGFNSLALGELYGQTGKQSKALECFVRAYNHFQTDGDANGAARAKDRMASALVDLGDFEQALHHLHDALKVFELIEEEERAAHTNYRISWTLNLAERHTEAEPYIRKAISFYRSNKHWSEAALAELQLCESLMLRDPAAENPEASQLLSRIIAYFESVGEQANVITSNALIAEKLTMQGSYKEATAAWNEILQESIGLYNPYFIRMARLNVAECLSLQGNFKEAAAELSKISPDWGEDKLNSGRYESLKKTLSQDIESNRE